MLKIDSMILWPVIVHEVRKSDPDRARFPGKNFLPQKLLKWIENGPKTVLF